MKKICKECGKEFEASHANSLFCCRSCQRKNYYSRQCMLKKCVVCGKIFTTTSNSKKTCSPFCSKKNNKIIKSKLLQRIIEEKDGNYTCTYNIICCVCGKEFKSKSYNIKTCSKECKEKHLKELITLRTERERILKKQREKLFMPQTRKCHDCGQPTTDYRCHECHLKHLRKYKVSEGANYYSDACEGW